MNWEYATVRIDASGWMSSTVDDTEVTRRLNSFGAMGWELVSVVPVINNGYTSSCLFVLKRPREVSQ